MPRLFIAISVAATPPLRVVLEQLAQLQPAVRTVAADQLHLTLRFLGSTPEHLVAPITGAMDRAVAGGDQQASNLAFTGLGRFPEDPRRPARVVFSRATHASEPTKSGVLQTLAVAVDRELDQLDPPLGSAAGRDRPFRPHLTLGRVKIRHRPGSRDLQQIEALREVIAVHSGADLGQSPIDAARLVESNLTARGSIYTTRHQVPLPSPSSR